VFETVLGWIFNLLLAKRAIPKLIRQICEDPEAVGILRRNEEGGAVQIYKGRR
jgi:hypothetical protein